MIRDTFQINPITKTLQKSINKEDIAEKNHEHQIHDIKNLGIILQQLQRLNPTIKTKGGYILD
jgi:hypothetical protein